MYFERALLASFTLPSEPISNALEGLFLSCANLSRAEGIKAPIDCPIEGAILSVLHGLQWPPDLTTFVLFITLYRLLSGEVYSSGAPTPKDSKKLRTIGAFCVLSLLRRDGNSLSFFSKESLSWSMPGEEREGSFTSPFSSSKVLLVR